MVDERIIKEWLKAAEKDLKIATDCPRICRICQRRASTSGFSLICASPKASA